MCPLKLDKRIVVVVCVVAVAIYLARRWARATRRPQAKRNRCSLTYQLASNNASSSSSRAAPIPAFSYNGSRALLSAGRDYATGFLFHYTATLHYSYYLTLLLSLPRAVHSFASANFLFLIISSHTAPSPYIHASLSSLLSRHLA